MIIDGKKLAKGVRRGLKQECAALAERGIQPGLGVVLVGDDPASAIYVRNKTRACRRVGIEHFDHLLPADTSEGALIELVRRLDDDPRVHGILVQLPLPPQIDAGRVLRAVDPEKDADGIHPYNLGRLLSGSPTILPCTPAGVIHMIKQVREDLVGADALVVGRSALVGKPVAQLLLAEHCTVTTAHSRTKDLPGLVGRAEVLVVAVGSPELVKGAWIKEGATVIDVGTNRVDDRLVGDVEFEPAAERAGAISPVPGGVGPMTIAMLLSNTVAAARRQEGAESGA